MRTGWIRTIPSTLGLSNVGSGTYIGGVATAETSPAPAAGGASIILETQRGTRKIPVTLRYSAVREVRDLATQPDGDISGLLRGRWDREGIVLEHATTVASDPNAVGVFRLQAGGWSALTLADRKKLNSVGLVRGVVVVVRTLAQHPWSATLFTVEPDSDGGEAPLAEFPWDEYVLRNGWLADLAPPDHQQARLALLGDSARSRRWVAVAALIAIAGAGGAAAYRWLPSRWNQPAAEVPADPPRPAASPVLGLKVARQAQDLEVSWDRGSEPVRLAGTGTLTIRSGPSTRVIALRPDQLREGRVVFQPVAGVDTDLRLEVLETGGKSAAESAQVIGFDTVPAVAQPAPPAARKAAIKKSDNRKEAIQKSDNRKEKLTPAGVRRPNAIAPAPGRNDAVPVRRTTPELTSEVVREMQSADGKVTVSVLMSIDHTGRVDDAKVVASTGEPTANGPYLRLAALSAARQWRFRPAIADGKPVPSQVTVLFTF